MSKSLAFRCAGLEGPGSGSLEQATRHRNRPPVRAGRGPDTYRPPAAGRHIWCGSVAGDGPSELRAAGVQRRAWQVPYVDDPGFEPSTASGLNYSPGLRRVLNLAAVAIALLPVPVALLGVLPVYSVHGRFLVFYAPFVCLLTLAYVVYVRDSLARIMFAHLLDPPPPPDLYGNDPLWVRVRRMVSGTRRVALAVLPGVLLLASFACVSAYTALLADSVRTVARTDADRLEAPEEVGALSLPSMATGVDGVFELWGRLPAGDSVAVPRRFLEVTPDQRDPLLHGAHPALHRGLPRPTPRGIADGRAGVRQGRAWTDRARRRAGPPAGRPGVVGTQLAEPSPGPVFHAEPHQRTSPNRGRKPHLPGAVTVSQIGLAATR